MVHAMTTTTNSWVLITGASSGFGEEFSRQYAEQGHPLILMDVQMPVMGGLEATSAIRERERSAGGHVRIIAMTAHALNGDRERCLASGMDGYLSKPIDPKVLYSVVEQDLDAQPAATAGRTAEPQATAPGFDPSALRARVDGDEELVATVVRMFLEDCPARLAAIRDAVERRDGEGMRVTAHALKGAAGNLGAVGLFEAASILERIGAESQIDAADAAWRLLSTEWMNVLDALRRFEDSRVAESTICAS